MEQDVMARFQQVEDRISTAREDQIRLDSAFTEFKASNERRLNDLSSRIQEGRVQSNQQFNELKLDLEKKFEDSRRESGRQIADLRAEVDKKFSDLSNVIRDHHDREEKSFKETNDKLSAISDRMADQGSTRNWVSTTGQWVQLALQTASIAGMAWAVIRLTGH